ncbi:A24 family peptidase [Nocardia nova]|uniref:A24 family peptidase n=1 Tax=Nocardia nova TaxID=37330 RepID=UPI00340291A7
MYAIALAALVIWCAVLSAIDIRTRRLPDTLTLPGAVAVLAVATLTGHGSAALCGALLLAVPYLLVHLIAPVACGGGDVKLALGTGAAAACGGAQSWVWAALGAPLLTALAGAGIVAATRFAGPGGGPIPDTGSIPAPMRDPPLGPGPALRNRAGAGPGVRASGRVTRFGRSGPPRAAGPRGDRSAHADSRCARCVLAAPITVPHGPAMCLATVAALWATR